MIRFAKSVIREIQRKIWESLALALEQHKFQSGKVTITYTFEIKNYNDQKEGTVTMNDINWLEASEPCVRIES